MKITQSPIEFARLPKDYPGLCRWLMPRPIRDKMDLGNVDAWSNNAWTLGAETRRVDDRMRVLQERDANNAPTLSYTRGLGLGGGLESAAGSGGLLGRTDLSPFTVPWVRRGR